MQRLPLTVPLTVHPHYHTLGMTPNHGYDETCAWYEQAGLMTAYNFPNRYARVGYVGREEEKHDRLKLSSESSSNQVK